MAKYILVGSRALDLDKIESVNFITLRDGQYIRRFGDLVAQEGDRAVMARTCSGQHELITCSEWDQACESFSDLPRRNAVGEIKRKPVTGTLSKESQDA